MIRAVRPTGPRCSRRWATSTPTRRCRKLRASRRGMTEVLPLEVSTCIWCATACRYRCASIRKAIAALAAGHGGLRRERLQWLCDTLWCRTEHSRSSSTSYSTSCPPDRAGARTLSSAHRSAGSDATAQEPRDESIDVQDAKERVEQTAVSSPPRRSAAPVFHKCSCRVRASGSS